MNFNYVIFSLITILITARSEGIVAEQTEKRTEAYRQKISNTNFTREKCQWAVSRKGQRTDRWKGKIFHSWSWEFIFKIILDTLWFNYYINFIYAYSNVFKTLKKSYDRFHILSMAVKVDLEPEARHELRLSKQQCHHQVLKCLLNKI